MSQMELPERYKREMAAWSAKEGEAIYDQCLSRGYDSMSALGIVCGRSWVKLYSLMRSDGLGAEPLDAEFTEANSRGADA